MAADGGAELNMLLCRQHLLISRQLSLHPAPPSQHTAQLKHLNLNDDNNGHNLSTTRPKRTMSAVLESSHQALSIRHLVSLIGAKFENRSG